MSDKRTAPTRGSAGRETWLDVAKGACILLVVLWHVVTKWYLDVAWHSALPFPGFWGGLGTQLLPLRMPVFFAVSGVLAASAVQRSWPELLRSRVAKFAALYVLWVVIQTMLFWPVPGFGTAHARSVGELVEQVTVSPTNLWYLYALALYFVLARLVRRVPTGVVLAVAAGVATAVSAGLISGGENRWQVLQNFLFFALGLRCHPQIRSFAHSVRLRTVALAVGGFAVVAVAMQALDASGWVGVWTGASLLAVLVGVSLAALASRYDVAPVRGLEQLGARTLPLYVLHLPVVALVDALLDGPLERVLPTGTVAAAVAPVMVTAVVVVISLSAYRVLGAVGLGRLFDPLSGGSASVDAVGEAGRRLPHRGGDRREVDAALAGVGHGDAGEREAVVVEDRGGHGREARGDLAVLGREPALPGLAEDDAQR